jgi:hypothetical protein
MADQGPIHIIGNRVLHPGVKQKNVNHLAGLALLSPDNSTLPAALAIITFSAFYLRQTVSCFPDRFVLSIGSD